MLRGKDNYEIASLENGKQRDTFVVDKFELAEEKNHIDITYILASSVPNGNGALLTAEELEKSKETIINQPLIIVAEWDNMPTGHSLEEFPKLSWGASVIGTHIASEVEETDGVTHLKTTARVWKIRYPEIAQTMVSLYEAGDLKFSMESHFTSQTLEGSVRTLHGVSFIGSAVVNNPANPFSYALEVAEKRKNLEKQKEEKIVNFEQAMAKLKELHEEAFNVINTEYSTVKTAADTKGQEVATLTSNAKTVKDALELANQKIDTLQGEIATLQTEKEQKELAEKQEKRFNELAQFIDFKEEEVAEKKEAYGKMDDETFALIVETAKRNKKEDVSKNVEFASDTGLELKSNGYLDGLV